MFLAELILTYALQSNVPLYVRETGPPYRESGVRLELHKPLRYGLSWDFNPFIWNSRTNTMGGMGFETKINYQRGDFTISALYETLNNVDRATVKRHHIFGAVELRWKFN